MKIDQRLFEKGKVVGVALSGGRDSASLFHYLLNNRVRLNIKVVAINVEHGIREESKAETEKIQAGCTDIGVPIKVYHVDALKYAKENKKTVEQSARILRYECFEDAVKSGFCDQVATAHHSGDDVETVLMRIFRGTGNRGLGGISESRDYILRPMLSVSRDEIDEYCSQNGVKYFDDETNEEQKYTRNFIRHSVLPLVRQKYPNVDEALLRLSRTSRIDEEHFEKIVADKLSLSSDGSVHIRCEDFSDGAVAYRLIAKAFNVLGVHADIEERHVSLIRNLANQPNGTVLNMPYFVIAVKEYDNIVLAKIKDKFIGEVEISGNNICLSLGGSEYSIKQVSEREGLCLDGEKIEGALIRTRREGDFFKRFGGGTKSLGDYFTDIHYPVRKRDSAMLIAKGSEVLAIFGVEISDKVKITHNTKKILRLYGGEDVSRRI